MGRRSASWAASFSMVTFILISVGCARSAAPAVTSGETRASTNPSTAPSSDNKGDTCNAATQVTPRTDDNSDGAIAPARDGIPSGAPDAAHLAESLTAHGIGLSSYLASMMIGLTLPGTKEAILCPDGRLFVRSNDAGSQPLKTGVGLVTHSGTGDATPYPSGHEQPLFWHPAKEILGSHPCAALVNDRFGPQLVYAVDLDNLDPIQDKPAS